MVAVLWICALIIWLALQISVDTRIQAEERVHLLRQSQAMYLAIGGAYEALGRMGQAVTVKIDEKNDKSWQPDGKLREVQYETGRALVVVQKETDKVNVNKASHAEMKSVLEKAGLEEGSADALADVIADFVDSDDTPGLHGAEKEHYKKLGLQYVPFDNELTSLDQLLLVPGITQKLFYGFDLDNSNEETSGGIPQIPILANEYSLFQMLTVYGSNVSLEQKEVLDEVHSEFVPWESGGTYRIISRGVLASGAPAVTLWMVVKYAPESEEGYQVLSRKII